jgi:hypothetical protein
VGGEPPAGWGASHAVALIDAVRGGRCAHRAATLIGFTENAAALPDDVRNIAHAERRWRQATPDNPTAWTKHLRSTEQDRFLDALNAETYFATQCLPWLLAAITGRRRIGYGQIGNALAASTAASSIARACHADVLSKLIRRAGQEQLVELTRFAVTSRMDAARAAVVRLLRDDPWNAISVVAAAPWDNLRTDVQTLILSAADHDDVCAALTFARGMRE